LQQLIGTGDPSKENSLYTISLKYEPRQGTLKRDELKSEESKSILKKEETKAVLKKEETKTGLRKLVSSALLNGKK